MTQISSKAPLVGNYFNPVEPPRPSVTESPRSLTSTVSRTPDYSPSTQETTESFLEKLESKETTPPPHPVPTGKTTEPEKPASSRKKVSFLKSLATAMKTFFNSMIASLARSNLTMRAERISKMQFAKHDLVMNLLLKDKLSPVSAFAVLDRLEEVYADMPEELIEKIASSKAARAYRTSVFELCMDIQNEKKANPNAAVPYIDETRFLRMRTVGHLFPETVQLISNTLDPEGR